MTSGSFGPEIFADAEFAEFVMGSGASPLPPARALGIVAARAGAQHLLDNRQQGPSVAEVRDLVIDRHVTARLYRATTEPRPTIVFFHGGGWIRGSVEIHDVVCRRLANLGDIAVLSAEYRLAPEHRWPAAVDDALVATRYAIAHASDLGGSPSVAVGGDSAGGNLAALVALALRQERSLIAQFLVYPNTDLTFSQPSIKEKSEGFGLTADTALFFAEQWVPDVQMRSDPRVSPLMAPELEGSPPALIVVAEHDPLRDEGVAYGRRLKAAGVEVTVRVEPGLTHGFLFYDTVSHAARAAGDRALVEAGLLVRSHAS